MHYFTFAEKDTTIYEDSGSLNAGLDEVLEVRKDVSPSTLEVLVSRTLISFDLSYISSSIVSGLVNKPKFYLNLYDANPRALAVSQSLYVYPVSQSWAMGSGRSYDNPITEDGCSWNYRFGELDGRIWSSTSGSGATWYQNTPSGSLTFVSQSAKMFGVTSSDEVQITVGGTEYKFIATSSVDTPTDVSPTYYFSTGSTTAEFGSNLITEINSADIGISASFSGSLTLQLTGSGAEAMGLDDISVDTGSGGTYSDIVTLSGGGVPYESSQSFNHDTTDMRMEVTDIVNAWLSSSIDNDGFIIKRQGNVGNSDTTQPEGNTDLLGNFSFFSSDTHTKYPPTMEMVWDDSKWTTGSLSPLTQTNLEDMSIYFKGLRPEYKEKSKAKFRVVGKERFPEKTYASTPSGLTVKYLPSGSTFYSIIDAETEDVIVPFGSGSLVSCDSSGNYFNINLNGYQPERYYRLELRVQSGSGTDEETDQYFDEGFTFKVSL